MPDIFPNEAYPSDAAVALLDATTDQSTGLAYIAKGAGPASMPPYEVQYNRRQQRENRRMALVTAGLVVDEGSLRVGVYPLDYSLGGQFKHFDGATAQAVPDNSTRYVYVDSANALQIAASEPADVTTFVPLAKVVTTSGAMTITPRINFARIVAPQLASSPAGNGLTLSAGALAVNVDNATLEINADALRLKDAGVGAAKLADAVADLVPQVAFNIGAEGSPGADDRVITLQLRDAQSNTLAARALLRIWIATADFGAPSATGNTVTVTAGTTYSAEIANAAYQLITDASGAAAIKINITGSATRYILAELDGRVYSTGAVNWT